MAEAVPIWSWGLSQLLLLLFLGGVPLGVPPLPEDKALVSAAPQECLLYSSWYGTAEASATSKNHVERLLAEPEVRRCFATLWKELEAASRRDAFGLGRGEAAMLSETILSVADILLSRPGSMFVSKFDLQFGKERHAPQRVDLQAGIVINAGPRADELQRILARLERTLVQRPGVRGDEKEPEFKIKEVTIGDVKLHELPLPPEAPKLQWGFHGQYLVVAAGDGTAEKIITALKTPRGPPAWLKQVHERLAVERPAAVSYIHVKAWADIGIKALGVEPRMAQRILEALGLDNVESLATVSGLAETDFVTKTLLATTGKPRGVLELLAEKPLGAGDLASVPRDATFAMVTRFDAVQAYKLIWEMMGELEPRALDRAKAELSRFEEQLGFRIREDLLESLGDVYALYSSPGEGGMLLGFTTAINVRDRDKLEKVSDVLRDMIRREGRGERGPALSSFRHAGQMVNVVDLGRGIPLAPSWCLTDNKLLLALYPQSIKAYLSRDAEGGSLAEVPEVAAALKDQPVMLSYQNTPELFRTFYPFLQMVAPMVSHELKGVGLNVDASLLPSGSAIYKHLRPSVATVARRENGILSVSRQTLPGGGMAALAPVAAGLAFPAYRYASDRAERAQSMNNLRQLGLAMHIFHDTHNALPSHASYDKDGKPLLSWRVHILPYLEMQHLWREFHHDEPWDSPHNKKLIAKMPPFYKFPGRDLREGKTCYLVPVGNPPKGKYVTTIFPKGATEANRGGMRGGVPNSILGIHISAISDGTSNVIMIIEAPPDRAVIWTKPDDWEFNPEKPAEGLFGARAEGLLAALADASVHSIRREVSPEMLKRMFERNDGQPVDFDRGPKGLAEPKPKIGAKVFEKPPPTKKPTPKDFPAKEVPKP